LRWLSVWRLLNLSLLLIFDMGLRKASLENLFQTPPDSRNRVGYLI
jgi:hypothetical protein